MSSVELKSDKVVVGEEEPRDRRPSEVDTMGQGDMLPNWSTEDQRKTVLKLDFYIMPLLLLAFFFLCLDRSNISNALTDNLTKDLHISTGQAVLGNQLQQAGIVIFELPFGAIMPLFGARNVLLFQMTAWSLVATFQSFIRNKAQYYATRFLLGTFEGGFIPGSMYLMSEFYTGEELSTRYAVFYFGNYFASGTSSLIAAGIFSSLDGVSGWAGWRWLFLIDGAMTIGFAVIVALFLPASANSTKPVHGLFDLFSPRDRQILQYRLVADNLQRGRSRGSHSFKEWARVLLNPRLWMHFLINLVGLSPAGGLLVFGPTIIKSLGFAKIRANALTSVGYYVAIVLAYLLSWFARWTRLNGVACLLPFLWSCIFAGVLYHVDIERSPDKWTLYALFILVLGAMLIEQPINNAWCGKNARTPRERSVGLALCVMGSNFGGLIGQQIFQAHDAPKYRRGFIAVLSLYAASVVIVVAQIGHYEWLNRRLRKRERPGEQNAAGEERATVKPFRYKL